MTTTAVLRKSDDVEVTDDTPSLVERIAAVARTDLSPIALEIDEGTIYPDQALRHLGDVGAWSAHADLRETIAGITTIGETCGSTAFMAWCQNTLVWYILNSDNAALKAKYLSDAAGGKLLGGTGLSNPMKSFFGIEKLKLKGRRADGGYIVRGALPWVSNLGPDHLFGTIFELDDGSGEKVMFLADCADENLSLTPCKPFLAMDGTGTYAVQFRDVFIPHDQVLAAPAMPFVKKIRAGFILMQMGMGLGLVRDCVAIMESVKPSLAHVNCFLPQQPEDFAGLLAKMEAETMMLAATPFDTSNAYWRSVVELRLRAGDAAVAAAHAAMLHCGARGYLKSHRAQRRLREAYFVAIVTPATKQLRKMLADNARDTQGDQGGA
ncbi:acyl-CoA dehydrogenase family protein [Tardiphaga sp. 42S5]|uniref:acyl-CoA dehydrogenase family protein n=1 Tax=Tardiphaga sp. 42S5 TaxID=1404799 RepID=UPI002A59B11C|nr:acyl-CoA dehydrogenase family protein [Tardiphaga sp. 42S5]WPO42208.1 acyl-CoA dehydrogenase family protein [Tardiphaga sp. 42S5]